MRVSASSCVIIRVSCPVRKMDEVCLGEQCTSYSTGLLVRNAYMGWVKAQKLFLERIMSTIIKHPVLCPSHRRLLHKDS